MSQENIPVVEIEWLEKHLNDPKVKVIEVDYDPATAYNLGHIPNSVLGDWKKDFNKYPERDIIDPEGFEKLMSRLGVSNDHTVILYGDYNNWFAAFAYWIFKIYGHDDVKLLNGGRKKWIDMGKPLVKDVPNVTPTSYKVKKVDYTIRATFLDVFRKLRDPNVVLVDVRSPDEFTGKILAPPEYPTEAAQRGGHIPGAVNIPWAQAVNPDGTFKSLDELRRLYESKGVTKDKEVIVYCRIGERASHTFFVLKELLKYPKVRVYDGSWSEWGNMVGSPVEK